ncbi:fumarylacetoacetate hydrolase family protein [Leucothrix pacifica]|uniref:fumarylacetoacetate hydrolase family protein n=1 Tax=Leucothrix pacifica TaxID=1247513 RepID=UPI003CCC5D8D
MGRNYAAHVKEGGVEPPTYPEFFYRGATSLIAHNAPIIRPKCSDGLRIQARLNGEVMRIGVLSNPEVDEV